MKSTSRWTAIGGSAHAHGDPQVEVFFFWTHLLDSKCQQHHTLAVSSAEAELH